MPTEQADPTTMTPIQLLVESQRQPADDTGSRFLKAAQQLVAAGRQTVVYLIDDGVGCAVDQQGDVARLIVAGARVVADERSLAQHSIPAEDLTPGVEAKSLDKVAPLLFDPAIQVVWH